MARTQFSEEQKIMIRQNIKREIKRQEEFFQNEEYNKIKNLFIEKFVLCERLYKMILKESNTIENVEVEDNRLMIHMNQVTAVLRAAGYEFDEALLNKLFKGTGKFLNRGTKSAKKLKIL